MGNVAADGSWIDDEGRYHTGPNPEVQMAYMNWWTEQRRQLASRLVQIRRDVPIPRRIGTGATVPVSYVQSQARIVFFDALYRRVPATTRDLAGPEAREIEYGRWEAFRRVCDELGRAGTLDDTPYEAIVLHPLCVAASEPKEALLDRWQERYNLRDHWVREHASATMSEAWRLWDVGGIEYDAPLAYYTEAEPDVHDGKTRPEPPDSKHPFGRFTVPPPAHELVDVPVYISQLIYPVQWVYGESGEPWDAWEEDIVPFAHVDPRLMTEEAIENVLIEALRPRVHRLAGHITAEDRELNGARAPEEIRKPEHFEWLVRYQVLERSKQKVSGDVKKNRSHVGREINKAAERIGLTLREETGGRPALDAA